MGVNLNDNIIEANKYHHNLDQSTKLVTKRVINPIHHNSVTYRVSQIYRDLISFTTKVHNFTKSVIDRRRVSFNAHTAKQHHVETDTDNMLVT